MLRDLCLWVTLGLLQPSSHIIIYRYYIVIIYLLCRIRIMGLTYFDKFSFGHLFGGILTESLLQYGNIPVLFNFILANIIHYMIECNEKSVAPDGRVLETYKNQIGDIICFFVGWMIAYISRTDRYVTQYNAPFLWFVLVFFTAQQYLREIYPYQTLFGGTYTSESSL